MVFSRTAGYGVAALTNPHDIVAAIIQGDGVGTVAGSDQNAAVARHGEILCLRAVQIGQDNGLKQRILIGIDAIGARGRDKINLRWRRGRERRHPGLNRYQILGVEDPTRVAATDEDVVDIRRYRVNTLPDEQCVKRSQV